MTNYKRLCRQLTAELVMKESRITERQLILLRWEQISDNGRLRFRQREVQLSETAINGIKALPHDGNYIFGKSPFSVDMSEQQSIAERILAII